jgi:murein DD-endopeptidase MepM/ murein hydrolase activator NlpD
MHLPRYACLIYCLVVAGQAQPQPDTVVAKRPADTAAVPCAAPPSSQIVHESPSDTPSAAETQEDNFQQSVDSLFDSTKAAADSGGWDNMHINAGRFESETWKDTARILLVDSSHNRLYAHPYCSYITSDFGQRRYLWHYGVDIKLHKGDSVRVAFSGIVRVIQYDRHGYGHVVVVRHADGLETLYGHLSREFVGVNQKVVAGEVIGLGGNSGHSTGSHLHFEMRYRGEPFDPHCIVDFENSRLKSDTLVLTRADFEYLVELRKQKWCTILSGDNLGHIAMRYHSTISKLCTLNGISRTTILRVGRKLRYQ